MEKSEITSMFRECYCEDCLKDPEIKCPRNADVQCLECGKKLCGYHMVKHLEAAPPEGHLISTTWKGIGAK